MATSEAREPQASKLEPTAPITCLRGVGPSLAAKLAAAGITTLLDLLLCFPRRYRALRELRAPDEAYEIGRASCRERVLQVV